MLINIAIMGPQTVDTKALIDSGAEGIFMDSTFAKQQNLTLKPLFKPITPRNVDGTINAAGLITHYTWQTLSIAGHKHRV